MSVWDIKKYFIIHVDVHYKNVSMKLYVKLSTVYETWDYIDVLPLKKFVYTSLCNTQSVYGRQGSGILMYLDKESSSLIYTNV